MQKRLMKVTLASACLIATCIGSWKAYSAYNVNDSNSDLLLTNDVEALSNGDVNWGAWLSHITDPIDYYDKKTWIKQTIGCTITETTNSGSINIEVSVGGNIVGGNIGYQSGGTTTSVTYPGHYISCVYDEDNGEEAHCSETDCQKDKQQ